MKMAVVKEVLFKEIKKLTNSVAKKEGVLQNKFNAEMLAKYVDKMEDLPESAPYQSLNAWLNILEKKEAKCEAQLDRIESNAIVLDVLNKHVATLD